MMTLPIAATAFAVLAIVCTLAYNADSGPAFLALAILNILVATFLMGMWTSEVLWSRQRRREQGANVTPEDGNNDH